jgi:hypothetical protein
MSAPIRFLAVLVVGWAGVRAATLGYVPPISVSYAKPVHMDGPEQVEGGRSEPAAPPADDAVYASAWPTETAAEPYLGDPGPPGQAHYVGIPQPQYYYAYAMEAPAAPPAIPPRAAWEPPSMRSPGPEFYTAIEPLERWEVADLSNAAFPERQSSPVPPVLTGSPAKAKLDRWQMSSWALLRGVPMPDALAAGGTLGGSQAGARVTYAFNRSLAASLRTTSPVGGSRGAEVAGGIRFTPFRSIPIAITAERRQAISPHGGGRSAFALFAEGGLYRRPMPLGLTLDAYLQAGIVGLKSRDYFADGALAFSRPLYGRVSAGFGVWGGVQPGLYRIDAGPRLSLKVRDNIHAHVEWRQRLIGNAEPASGPALTLAADF